MSLKFYSDSTNGLIFYTGPSALQSRGDFLAVGLSEGYVELRFDLGSGVTVLKSETKILLGQWHTIEITRESNQLASLALDGDDYVESSSIGPLTILNVPYGVYLGAKEEGIPGYVGFADSFAGCVSHLELQGNTLDVNRDLVKGAGVIDCPRQTPCDYDPCENGGSCFNADADRYRCQCAKGYAGVNCEHEITACYLAGLGCANGGECRNASDGPRCVCLYDSKRKLAYTGKTCSERKSF